MLPRTSVLCRLLVLMTVLFVFVQAVSCGMFFCVTLPMITHSGAATEYQDLSAPGFAVEAQQPPALLQQQQPLKAVPKLIPRVIHQTYRNGRLPASTKSFMRTWAEVNGDSWQVRFYSDDAALSFVRREFPEYFEAYLSLPKDVERADFFRYMVVLRLGGAYADIDAECRQPLDRIIQPADTLLVGWDTEVRDASSAAATGLARQRLIANWFFVAAAGHPVLRELCDHIAHKATSTFSTNGVRDTAERTGQGVWTDTVLQHALAHPVAKHDDPWKVRILPRVAFGVRPVGDDAALRPDTPGVVVLHHFLSSWQADRHRRLMQALRPLLSWSRPSQLQQIMEPVEVSNVTHFPVSIAFNPPFTLMADLVGSGDMQAAEDVSAVISAHGTWQPGVAPQRKPAVVEALVGALAKHSQRSSNSPLGVHSSSATPEPEARLGQPAAEQAGYSGSSATAAESSNHGSSSGGSEAARSVTAATPGPLRVGVLVDVGAGQGFFSLAAAARGHRVIAFEVSPTSLAALEASITYNGFQDLITVHSAALGMSAGAVCLQQAEKPGCRTMAAAAAASLGKRAAAANDSSEQQDDQEVAAAVAQMQLRQRRGYPWRADAGAGVRHDHACCAAAGRRLRLSDVLQNTTDVAALRISAHGHEGFILQGGIEYLRHVHKPDVIYVEFWPAALRAAGFSNPAALLRMLFDVGYTDIAHAGRMCDARWHNATQRLHLQGSFSSVARAALLQPTWCKLRPEQFHILADTTDAAVPENVMFLLGAVQPSSSAAPDSVSDGSRSTTTTSIIASGRSESSSSGSSSAPSVPSGSVRSGSDAAADPSLVAQLQQAAAPQPTQPTAPQPSLAVVGADNSRQQPL